MGPGSYLNTWQFNFKVQINIGRPHIYITSFNFQISSPFLHFNYAYVITIHPPPPSLLSPRIQDERKIPNTKDPESSPQTAAWAKDPTRLRKLATAFWFTTRDLANKNGPLMHLRLGQLSGRYCSIFCRICQGVPQDA